MEQMAGFCMAIEFTMQQVVDVALSIPPLTGITPDQVLDLIADHILAKPTVGLDRLAFEESWKEPSESFDDL
jgi:hypothetical protein